MAQIGQRGTYRTRDLTALIAGTWRSVSRRQSQIVAAWNRHLTGRYGFNLNPFLDFVRSRFSPRSYLGLHLTIGLIAVAALAWLFGGIVDAISDQGSLGGLDRTVALFVAAQRTSGLDSAVGVIAALANPIWLAFVVGVGALSYGAGARRACLSWLCFFSLEHTYSPSGCR